MVAKLAPGNVTIEIYNSLEYISAFNPNKKNYFTTVANLREKLSQADGIIICTHEYAFGVPGVKKNI